MKIKTLSGILLAASLAAGSVSAGVVSQEDKVLVAYFSRSGNTREIAQMIQQNLNADLWEIEVADAYPDEYKALTEQAKKEIAAGYKPVLKNSMSRLGDYKVIFVGSPCWWGTIAPPVLSFLSAYDFEGKTVVPFMTHGGSGLGHSVEDIRALIPGAVVADGKAFWGNRVKSSGDDVKKWLKGLQND